MDFPAAQGLLNNIQKLTRGDKRKWSNWDIKEMTLKTEILHFDFGVWGNYMYIGHNLSSVKRILIY